MVQKNKQISGTKQMEKNLTAQKRRKGNIWANKSKTQKGLIIGRRKQLLAQKIPLKMWILF